MTSRVSFMICARYQDGGLFPSRTFRNVVLPRLPGLARCGSSRSFFLQRSHGTMGSSTEIALYYSLQERKVLYSRLQTSSSVCSLYSFTFIQLITAFNSLSKFFIFNQRSFWDLLIGTRFILTSILSLGHGSTTNTFRPPRCCDFHGLLCHRLGPLAIECRPPAT